MKPALWDMHVHLDFMQDTRKVAEEAEAEGLGMFAVTVTPQGYQQIFPELNGAANVCLGVGLHPWWAADGRCGMADAEKAAELIKMTQYVGEIGLDASPKHVPEGSINIQSEIFEIICKTCADSSETGKPKILSLHSVKAGTLTLDILEQTGCLDKCRCIFHWFTGSSDELNRAAKSGCYFSVNEMMLHTRRGREYARQMPKNQILLETDLPPGNNVIFSPDGIIAPLEKTLAELQLIRSEDMRNIIRDNSERVLRD